MAVFLNDRFLNNDEAMLHVSDLSMQRGYAIFDFFRTINGNPLFLRDHLDRFAASAEALHLPVCKSRDELTDILQELIRRSGLADAGLRIMLTGGYSTDSYHPSVPNLVISCNPVKTASASDFDKGYAVCTYSHQRELPHVKSINYLTALWLQPLLREKAADDVLYYNAESITEFPRSNVFMVTEEGQLLTPARNMLKGITRKAVLSIAETMMPVEERDIPVEMLLGASEVFLTSTTKKILPVLSVDGLKIGKGRPGPVTTNLYHTFLKLEAATVLR